MLRSLFPVRSHIIKKTIAYGAFMTQSFLTPVYGVIQNISQSPNQCCDSLITLLTSNGLIRFAAGPDTFIIDSARLSPGMSVAAFYDPSLPVPLIFPPQYQAVIIARRRQNENVAAGFFDRNLVAADQSLQLNIGASTEVTTANGLPFPCSPGGQYLAVFYTATTRSIPPQTAPRRIVVFC